MVSRKGGEESREHKGRGKGVVSRKGGERVVSRKAGHVLAGSEMGKGVSGQRSPHHSCRSRSLSFALVVVRVPYRSRSLSFASVIVRVRCRSRLLLFAFVVVRVRYRSRSSVVCLSIVVTWGLLAANRNWAVDGGGVASVDGVSIKVMRLLTVYINCKTMTTTTKLSSSSSSLPRHSLGHRYGAVGGAGGGRWCLSWSVVVVWRWLRPLHVVVVVRRSWAFVGRLSSLLGGLSSFLSGRGRLRGLGLWEVDVVAGRMCIVIVRCVVVMGSVVGTWWLLNEEAMSQLVTLAC